MKTKEIILSSTAKLTMDDQGRWTLVDTECGLNERILESEAIDVLVRRSKKDQSLKPLIRQHFPMYGFHDEEPRDRTPSHKSDY